jgi:hypothetical protein
MKRLLITLLPLILMAGCSTTHQLINVDNGSISSTSSGEQPSLETIEKAIVKACRRKDWIPRRISAGVLEASVHLRGHQADIVINFDTSAYSITYKDSENLDYRKRYNGKEYIHRNYNRWINNLDRAIQSELSFIALNYE